MHSNPLNIEFPELTIDSISQDNTSQIPNFNFPFPYLTSESFDNIKNFEGFNKLDNINKIITNESFQEGQLPMPISKKKVQFYINNSLSTINQTKEIDSNLEKGKLGRKRKNDNSKRVHNKYSDDNIIRKCKHLVLNSVMEFINEKLKLIYNQNKLKKKLLSFDKTQKADASVDYNKNFLTKKLREIFSENISTKFTNFVPENNKLIIERLTNEDENNKIYFNKLFNLTFLQCLNHYIGANYIKELDGMKCFNDDKNKIDDKDGYVDILKYYLNNFEERIMGKKSRKQRK